MPKRTNIFQRLVKLLHDRLDANWVVNESEMLVHRLTGEEREVDILMNRETIKELEDELNKIQEDK